MDTWSQADSLQHIEDTCYTEQKYTCDTMCYGKLYFLHQIE